MILLARNPIAAGLMVAMILVGGLTGAGWYLAARDRDAAWAELAAERDRSAKLAAAVARQNEAIDALATATATAEARGQAAQQVAAANGRRFDRVLAATRATHALNCADAMPVVDMVRDAVR